MNLEELNKHKKQITVELGDIERRYERSKTNHLLHFLISILSFGGWIIIWICITLVDRSTRQDLANLIDETKETLIQIDTELIPKAQLEGKIKCSWCAEEILAEAKLCKHCGKEVASVAN